MEGGGGAFPPFLYICLSNQDCLNEDTSLESFSHRLSSDSQSASVLERTYVLNLCMYMYVRTYFMDLMKRMRVSALLTDLSAMSRNFGERKMVRSVE